MAHESGSTWMDGGWSIEGEKSIYLDERYGCQILLRILEITVMSTKFQKSSQQETDGHFQGAEDRSLRGCYSSPHSFFSHRETEMITPTIARRCLKS